MEQIKIVHLTMLRNFQGNRFYMPEKRATSTLANFPSAKGNLPTSLSRAPIYE